MVKHIDLSRWLAAGFLSCVLLVAACNSGSSGSGGGSGAPSARQPAARVNVGDSTEAGEGAQTGPQRAVISERLPYAEVDDELVYGYFVFPSEMVEPLPAVIMIHEWWGLNDDVRAAAEKLAAEGYIVLAVDLFDGEVATTSVAARQLILRAVQNSELASQNIRQAYAFLSTTAGAPRIASVGWDFGGDWSLNTALLFPDELDAAVIYYGQVNYDEERLQPINVPILGFFGAKDTVIKVESVEAFKAALERLRKPHEIHIYPRAGHAFANPTARAYDGALADDAWQKTLEFLGQNLLVAAESSE